MSELQFPEDIAGQRPSEALPAFDLGGRSAKDVVSTMCFSSGTTGKMKGVMLSHLNLIANTLQYRASLPSVHNGSQREVFFAPCKPARINSRVSISVNVSCFQTATFTDSLQ